MPLTVTRTPALREPESRSRLLSGPPPPGQAEWRQPGSGESGRPTQPACGRLFGVCSPACHVTAAEKVGPSLGPSTGFRVRSGPGPCAAARLSSLAPLFGRPLRARPGPTKPPGPRLGWSRNGGFRPRLPRSDGPDRRRRRLIYGPEQPRKRRRFVHGAETPWQCLRFARITAKQRPASRASVGGPARGAPGEGAGGGPGGAGACAVSSCAISAWRKQSFRF